MWRDDHPLQLLVGHIGEREHRPVALVLRGRGAHFDAPADAIGPSGSGDLKCLALVEMNFRGGGQVERGIIPRDFDWFGGMAYARTKPGQRQEYHQEASGKPQQARAGWGLFLLYKPQGIGLG
ncbi:hypothetical protein RvVAR0630_30900 [Agrobacterium vitis]|nr:hypothetical protein RvVAR0630_30900 [Agrobacterium vitis]